MCTGIIWGFNHAILFEAGFIDKIAEPEVLKP